MMDEYKQEKANFTSVLLPLLKAIDGSITAVEYRDLNVRDIECVVIKHRNKHQKSVNVTGDSLKALAIDVLETL